MALQYSGDFSQCVKCGCTYHPKDLKVARRIDDIMRINEEVLVCVDERSCMKMKLGREELFRRKGVKPFVPSSSSAPLKKPKPVRQTSTTLQYFPRIDSVLARAARKKWRNRKLAAKRAARMARAGR